MGPGVDVSLPGDPGGVFDVRRSPELQATLLALKQVDRSVRRDVGKRARASLRPVWTSALQGEATTLLERSTLLPGAKIQASGQRFAVIAGGSGRALSGGLIPDASKAPEFGSGIKLKSVQLRSRKGKPYTARRMQGRQFKRPSKGYVVNPAAGKVGRKLVASWVADVIDVLRTVGEVR